MRIFLIFVLSYLAAVAGPFPFALSQPSGSTLGVSGVVSVSASDPSIDTAFSAVFGDCSVNRTIIHGASSVFLTRVPSYLLDTTIGAPTFGVPTEVSFSGIRAVSMLPSGYVWPYVPFSGSVPAPSSQWTNTCSVSILGGTGATYTASSPLTLSVTKTDSFVSLASGTSVMSNAINSAFYSMLNGATAATVVPLYNYPDTRGALTATRNTSNYLTVGGYDVTGHSAVSSTNGPCTVITPRHAVYAAHYGPQTPGSSYFYFITAANVYVQLTVSNYVVITDPTNGTQTDLALITFSSDVPSTIAKYKLPPANWFNYMPSSAFGCFPTVTLSNNYPSAVLCGSPYEYVPNPASIGDYSVAAGFGEINSSCPYYSLFTSLTYSTGGHGTWGDVGDSSSAMLLLNPSQHELCIFGVSAHSSPTGQSVPYYKSRLNAAMAADYAAGRTPTLYTCTESDWSAYNFYAPVGIAATLTATSNGTPPFTYQWAKNGTTITGATANPLVISNAQTTDSGTYACTVTNSGGATTATIPLVVQ